MRPPIAPSPITPTLVMLAMMPGERDARHVRLVRKVTLGSCWGARLRSAPARTVEPSADQEGGR